MADIKFDTLTEKTVPHKDDLLVIADMENDLSKSVKFGTIKPYKVYTALIKQVGTDAPTATVLENTLGGTVVWTRVDVGQYRATLTGAFGATKTFAFSGIGWGSAKYSRIDTLNANYVNFYYFSDLGTTAEDFVSALYSYPIEIRVYN